MDNLNILFFIPLGILFNMIIHNLSDIIVVDNIEKKLMFLLIFAVIGILIGKFMIDNKTLRYGLYFGCSILLYYTLIMNWDVMDKYAKIILICIIFGYVIKFAIK
jgi:hypothetical protein